MSCSVYFHFSSSSRGPRRYDSMPARHENSSYNNRSSFPSNFSRPPPPFDESRSSTNRSSGPLTSNPRPSQNASTSDSTQPPFYNNRMPLSGMTGSDAYQSMYPTFLNNMYMQQAPGLSSTQNSTTNSM